MGIWSGIPEPRLAVRDDVTRRGERGTAGQCTFSACGGAQPMPFPPGSVQATPRDSVRDDSRPDSEILKF